MIDQISLKKLWRPDRKRSFGGEIDRGERYEEGREGGRGRESEAMRVSGDLEL